VADDPADRMRERSERSTVALYLLLEADRQVLAGALVAAIFLALLGASMVFPGAAEALATGDPIETAFQALIGATITGVTLVLTLNQLVLSQEQGAVGDQRDRMDGAMTFRDDVADLLGERPPAEPSAFLRAMVSEIADRAETLREASRGESEDLDRLVESTLENANDVDERLEDATFGQFEVVRSALDFNYSWKLYEANRLLDDDAIVPTCRGPLSSFADALKLYGPAREHFKTLYFQSELIELSRAVLYAALPSLVVTLTVMYYVDVSAYPGQLLGLDRAVLLISAASAVAVAPFAILLSYVTRIATITGRTLSIGPFILRETERETDD
jgi:hypothetical protein